jgi:hypothetical protein
MNFRFALLCLCCLAVHKGWASRPPSKGAGLASSGANGAATSAANPYAAISKRNIFHLNPEPAPPRQEPPPADLPAIKICGFMVNAGHVRALFASVPKNAREPQRYYDLSEGEADGILQLVKIHLDKEAAEVINSGVPMRLTMQENGFQAPSAKSGNALTGTAPRQIPGPPPLPQPGGPAVPP